MDIIKLGLATAIQKLKAAQNESLDKYTELHVFEAIELLSLLSIVSAKPGFSWLQQEYGVPAPRFQEAQNAK